MSLYTGTDQYPLNLNLPDPNTPATAEQLAQVLKDLADRGIYVMRRAGIQSDPSGPVAMDSTDGTSIVVQPLGGVMVTDAVNVPRFIEMPMVNTLTVANLDTQAGNFDGSKNYGVYLYFDTNAGLPKFEISAAMPDPTGFFQQGTTTRRFVGGFSTDASAKIRRFSQLRGAVRLHRTVSLVLAGNQVNAAAIDLTTGKGVPPYARFVSLRVEVISALGNGSVTLGPKGSDFAGGDGWRVNMNPNANARTTAFIENVPLSADRKLEYLVNVGATTATIDLIGYSF